MQVQNWMSTGVITVTEDTPIVDVLHSLETHGIRHIPVIRDRGLVGMITDQDVKEATPSKTATMTARELYCLLAELKARDVMQPNPVLMRPYESVELAALRMLENKVTGMPVATDEGELVGVISQVDVLRFLVSITGIYQRGVQFGFNLEDRPGSIRDVADVIRREKAQIVSILSSTDTADEGYRHVFMRIKPISDDALERLIASLNRKFMVLYTAKDPIDKI
ncbi:MAG TPA: CBS domain-containing protein [Desulfobacteraceae bacterium]|nr:CBS domain-containing protein [Desulfobacteraceae bacterium]